MEKSHRIKLYRILSSVIRLLLYLIQRRTGVVHDASAVKSQVKHVRRTRSADKSRSRQNGEVEEEDESDFVDSWRFNTAQKGKNSSNTLIIHQHATANKSFQVTFVFIEIGEEEERLFLLQRAEIEFLEYRKCQSLTASPAHTRK